MRCEGLCATVDFKLRPVRRPAVWIGTRDDHLNTYTVNLVRCSVDTGSEAYTVIHPMHQTPHIHTSLADKRCIYQSLDNV